MFGEQRGPASKGWRTVNPAQEHSHQGRDLPSKRTGAGLEMAAWVNWESRSSDGFVVMQQDQDQDRSTDEQIRIRFNEGNEGQREASTQQAGPQGQGRSQVLLLPLGP